MAGRQAASGRSPARVATDGASKGLRRQLATGSRDDLAVASTRGTLLQGHIALLIEQAPALSVEQLRCLQALISPVPAP